MISYDPLQLCMNFVFCVTKMDPTKVYNIASMLVLTIDEERLLCKFDAKMRTYSYILMRLYNY